MASSYSHIYELYHLYDQSPFPPRSNERNTTANMNNNNNRGGPSSVHTNPSQRWRPSRLSIVVALSLALWVFAVVLEMEKETEAHTVGTSHLNFALFHWDDYLEEVDGQSTVSSLESQTNHREPFPNGPFDSHMTTTTTTSTSTNLIVPTLIHLRRNEQQQDEQQQQQDNSQPDPDDPNNTAANNNNGNNLPTNPQIYGWTPEMYPNPLLDPVRCSIAFLPEEQQAIMKRAIANGDERDLPEPLRLCDPDWMLGGMYMEQIAFALRNFSEFFGQPDWDVTVGTNEVSTYVNNNNKDEEGPNASITTATGEEHAAVFQPRVQLAVATVRKVGCV